jgi:hypothetical protein
MMPMLSLRNGRRCYNSNVERFVEKIRIGAIPIRVDSLVGICDCGGCNWWVTAALGVGWYNLYEQ